MADYKELVSVLRSEADGFLMANAPDVLMADSLNSAADAIEELLLENDALGRSLCECDDLLKKLERENRRNAKGNAMRLIDADALMERFAEMQKMGKTDGTEYACNFMSAGQEPSAEWYTIEDAVDNAPTVDAVQVVRCKDCQKRDPEDHKCDCGQFERQGCPFPVDDDYLCKYGERREWGADDER